MRKACSLKFTAVSVCLILAGILPGCSAPAADTISLGEWISLLDQKAGISSYSHSEPYYLNVPKDSPYFEAVQSAVEYSVLDTSAKFDPNAVLTREWTAYTLMNLAERDVKGDQAVQIRDIGKSAFPDHISAAVACGLMDLDSHNRFLPSASMDKEEALQCLSVIASQIDHPALKEPYTELDFMDDLPVTEETATTIDPESGTAEFSKDADVHTGELLVQGNEEAPEAVYKITDIKKDDESTTAIIEPAQAEEVIEKAEAADSFSVDFTTAKITDAMDGTVIQDPELSESHITPAALKEYFYTKTHEINGYKISYSVKATGVKAEIEKVTPLGMRVFGNLTIASVKPSYRWKMENGTIKDGFFKMEYLTTENLGAEAEMYKKLYGDFSKVDPKNFLGTVQNLFQEKKDGAEITLPLAKIEVPVPSSPVLTILMQLQLTLRANGKAQLTLSQDNSVGMEIRDGVMRDINHTDMKAEGYLRANTDLLGGVNMAMKLAGMKIADITAEAGATASVDSIAHLYDSTGGHTIMKAGNLPADLVDEMADGNENVLTCADIRAYKKADLKFNSEGTLASRCGLSKTIVLADEKTGTLFPGLNGHMENGHFVDHCTRTDRLPKTDTGSIVESDQIRIASYSLIADPGETKEIIVKALPKGYSLSDLIVTADDTSVASASGTRITANKEGSTIIHIQTSDGKYDISCSILVRHKS